LQETDRKLRRQKVSKQCSRGFFDSFIEDGENFLIYGRNMK